MSSKMAENVANGPTAVNSLPSNEFKKALASGRHLIGLWCNFAYLPTVECVAHSGFDWLLLDMEVCPTLAPFADRDCDARK
jgi:hypothetical protein